MTCCTERILTQRCQCKTWHVCPSYSTNPPVVFDLWDTSRPIKAVDAQTAAEKWAERDDRDSADYHIIGGSSTTVAVWEETSEFAEESERTGEIPTNHTCWLTSGEVVPVYRATEVGR